jgi:hypothetical protein
MPKVARLLAAAQLFAAALLSPWGIRLWAGTLRFGLGDVTTPSLAAALTLAALAALTFATRRRLDAALARTFETPKHWAFLAVGLSVTALFGLALAEVGLRVLHRPFKDDWVPSENALGQFDPDLGWVYRPHISQTQPFGEPPRQIPMHFEGHGFRAKAADDDALATRPTLALVGGSFVMGHGVTWEESLAGQLAERLPYQVVNMGVQGYGTDQALLRLRRHRAELDLKVVVYGFICDHVRRNANEDRRVLFPGARFLGTKPRFAVAGDGLTQVAWPARYEDLSYSRVGAYLDVAWTHYGPEPDLALTRALVQALDAEAKAAGARFLVLNWHTGTTAPELCGARPLEGLGVEVLTPFLAPPEGWSSWVIPGDYHPTPEGHAYVAAQVAEALSRP